MAKEKGIFGKKITFSVTAPARCSAGGQAQAAAPPPPPRRPRGGLRDLPDNSSTTNLSTPPPLPHPPPKNSSSTTTAAQRPPFAPELQHTPKNSPSTTITAQGPPFAPELRDTPKNLSSATTPPPPPQVSRSSPKNSSSTTTKPAPSTLLPGISRSWPNDPSPQPEALPLASTSSSPSGVVFFSCQDSALLPGLPPSRATVEDEGKIQSCPLLTCDEIIDSVPLKLLASKRTYLPSPNGSHSILSNAAASESQFSPECKVPNDGAAAKEKDEKASIGGMYKNRDGLLELASREPSKIKEKKAEFDYLDWNEDREENDQAVPLKFLANNKRCSDRPVLLKTPQCKGLTEVVKGKSYRKRGSSSSQRNDIASNSANNSTKLPNDGAAAKEKDEKASIGGMDKNRDGLLELASQGPSKIKEKKAVFDYLDRNEDREENDQAVSLKFLANNKRCPHHPVLLTSQCKGLTEIAKRKSYRKRGSSSSKRNDIASNSANNSLKLPNDGAVAKEKDEKASIGGMDKNRDRLLELASQEPSKIKGLTETAKHKSYRKRGSSSSQRNDIASHSADDSMKCCCHTNPMIRLDQFLSKRELTKDIELPGTSRSSRVTTSTRLEIRVILRRSIRLIYKLHGEGYCLEGSFSLGSFFVDDNLFVTLDFKEEDRKNYSRQGACKDLESFVNMVQSEIFGSQDMPSEIMRWISLIQKGGIDYEYLISYDCALMEHNQVLSTFMQLYSKLLAMKRSDYIGYQFVLHELNDLNGWSVCDLHNQYFFETYIERDKRKRKRRDRASKKGGYGSDVMSLLRLIRNTFQHITLKRFDKSGNIIFDEEDYEYILHDQFPNLLADLMQAMYITAKLADLNLEHVMV